MYKQKVKHLLYEHQNNITTLKADGELALKLQQDEFRKRETDLSKDKRNLKLELKEQVRTARRDACMHANSGLLLGGSDAGPDGPPARAHPPHTCMGWAVAVGISMSDACCGPRLLRLHEELLAVAAV